MTVTIKTLKFLKMYINSLSYLNILPYKMNEHFIIEVKATRLWCIVSAYSVVILTISILVLLKSVFDIKKYGLDHFVSCTSFAHFLLMILMGQLLIITRCRPLASLCNTFLKFNGTLGKHQFCIYLLYIMYFIYLSN